MQRRFLDYIIIAFKGAAMGAADAVPGVSGGTIAFISGIYQELINTISNVNLSLISTFKNEGLKAFWIQVNGNFLVALLTGIVISFASFMRVAKYLIENHPVLIWSFFFGLVIASILFIGKQIQKWSVVTVIAIILGASAAYYITTLPSLSQNDNPLFLFFAGAIAICAMILPGISGSFILLILGAYKALSNAIHDWDFKKVGIFALGALVGLLSFSRVLKWLFKNYNNTTLAVLTGFIFGSLNKIWPWKLTEEVMDKVSGNILPFSEISDTTATLNIYQQQMNDFESLKIVSEISISPNHYQLVNNNLDPQTFAAIGLMLVGFFTIFILEKLGSKQQ